MSRVSILFNTEMVHAILDGSKTCMREAVKLPKHVTEQDNGLYTLFADGTCYENQHMEELKDYLQQPYQLGDILYVRETWQYIYELDGNEQIIEDTGKYYYAATDTIPFDTYVDASGVTHERVPWRPSIHMPKEAARIWLKVTNVRVERLQEITEDGALREGAQGVRCNHAALGAFGCTDCMNTGWLEPPTLEFMGIWDSTIKKSDLDSYGWDANPWVWVIEFERCEKPEEGE